MISNTAAVLTPAAKNPFEKGFLDLPKLFVKGSFYYIVFFVSLCVSSWLKLVYLLFLFL